MTVGNGIWYPDYWRIPLEFQSQNSIEEQPIMPRIADDVLQCSIYLYPNADDAKNGIAAGGSGFLVLIPSEINPKFVFLYGVTNRHVVREGHSPVVRLNTHDDKFAIIDCAEHEWKDAKDDDISVCYLGTVDPRIHKFKAVGLFDFISPDVIRDYDIGIGDDVFLVGRFTTQEGKQRNLPSIRFGNIAMMPSEDEKVKQESGHEQVSFLVEMRSIGGYSGSPVFVRLSTSTPRPASTAIKRKIISGGDDTKTFFLGVDWGHLHSYEYLIDKYNNRHFGDEKWRVKSNSGMAGVVPAWKLRKLLYSDEVIMGRRKQDNEEGEKLAAEVGGTTWDFAQAEDHEVFTRDDFLRSLGRVSRPLSAPPDEEKPETSE